MKLKNILIVTEDVERSKKFYNDLIGLEVVSDNDGNVILPEGLVLQDKNIWKSFLDREIIPEINASKLYFEEKNIGNLGPPADAPFLGTDGYTVL